ncbi:MAG: hypothetical protein QOJ15_11928 [Bradyrhizobium sp.]|jgi:hypothetical protein|nr:hypothetical protein [Bradyrhizobium sp.]
MTNRFMISVAAAALIAGTGFANAQGTGTSREGTSGGSAVQQSAPSTSEKGNSAAPTNRDATESTKPSSGMKAQSDEKAAPGAAKNQRAQDDMKAGAKEKSAQDSNTKGDMKSEKSAQDNMKGEKSKSMSSETNDKGGAAKDMKAEGREGRDRNNMNAEQKGGADSRVTTGQAGASAKLSTEQRTRITSVIREQHVQPVTHVDFDIRPGIRVPRTVSFHPLPPDVVTVYPEWRGYEYFLVNDRIVVVNPRTMEIVDVIDV